MTVVFPPIGPAQLYRQDKRRRNWDDKERKIEREIQAAIKARHIRKENWEYNMTCAKCEKDAEHSLQIREGDPSRDPNKPGVPDKSTLRVVRLCEEHLQAVRKFLGL